MHIRCLSLPMKDEASLVRHRPQPDASHPGNGLNLDIQAAGGLLTPCRRPKSCMSCQAASLQPIKDECSSLAVEVLLKAQAARVRVRSLAANRARPEKEIVCLISTPASRPGDPQGVDDALVTRYVEVREDAHCRFVQQSERSRLDSAPQKAARSMERRKILQDKLPRETSTSE
jgi:hypothetical protein